MLMVLVCCTYTNHANAYGTDVVIGNSNVYINQKLEIDVAYNGWVFAVYNRFDSLTNYGGFVVKRSKDDGQTWDVITEANYFNTEYPDVDITVAGNDTNDMQFFVAGVSRGTSSGNYLLFIDKYDAKTGDLIDGGVLVHNTGTRKINDLAIANSYKNPAPSETPYSVGLVYSCFSSIADSVNFAVSMDGGSSFLTSKNVAITGAYFGDVAIAYGRSSLESSGRYYLAWHRRLSLAHNRGSIYTAHNNSFVNSDFSTPFAVDSVDPGTANKCSNPGISVSLSAYNDSIGVTAVVIMDRDYNNDGTDMDVITFHNRLAYSSEHWYKKDVASGGSSSSLQGDIAFDPYLNNFLVTYYDKTNGSVDYVANNLNMALAWTPIATRINNDTVKLSRVYPKVVINPSKARTAHAWIQNSPSGTFNFAFDAEYVFTGLVDLKEIGINVFPNPANNALTIQLSDNSTAAITIADLSGKEVMADSIIAQATIDISHLAQGMYVLHINDGMRKGTAKFVKQ